jgi:4-diphosphocytidyl-2-C-methyl-D-erythritol kinase
MIKIHQENNVMRVHAPAKINLNLRVVGKRADGYHHLQSFVAFTALGDVVQIAPADSLSLAIDGEFVSEISIENNLVIKGAQALNCNKGANILLTKNIPVGAGLGGGSADAAAILNALNAFWNLHYSNEKLQHIAASLGSDIGVCLASTPQWMEDTGHKITAINFYPSWHVLLVYPRIVLAAGDVYQHVYPPYSALQANPRFGSDSDWLRYFQQEQNDLTEPACKILPELAPLLVAMQALPKALLSRMSGSGSACFSLFDNAQDAENAQQIVQQAFPKYWTKITQFA